jgi:RND family efflux transporter MFP subunit
MNAWMARQGQKGIVTAAVAVVVAGLVVSVVVIGCARRHQAEGQAGSAPEVLVRTAAVLDTVMAQPVRATGTLTSKEEVPLSFKVGGVVARIEVEEGQSVPAGRRLAVLELPEIDAAVAKAQAGADKADRDLARARALYADSVITRELLENAETGREVASNDLAIARFNLRYATIVAPSAGIVLRRLAEPGQLVGPGTPVLYFGAASKGEVVRVGLTDRDVVRLGVDDPADVTFDAYPGRTWSGRVARLGAAAAPGAGTYEVEIRLDEPVTGETGAAGLASGLVGDVSIRPARAQQVRMVPVLSLLEGDGERAYVWSLDPAGAPRRHAVRVAFLEGDRAAIREGLEGIDRVVTDGAAYLTESSRVRTEPGR